MLPRLERNLDLHVTARRRGCNGSGDVIDMLLNERPLGAARQEDQGDATDAEVLLIADAPVGVSDGSSPPVQRRSQLAAAQPVPAPGCAVCTV